MKIKHIYYSTYVMQVALVLNIGMALWAVDNATMLWTQALGIFSIMLSVWVILRCHFQRKSIRSMNDYYRLQGQDYWNA